MASNLLSFGFCRFGQWEKIKALGLISFVNIDIEEGTLSFSIVVVVLLEVVKLQSCFLWQDSGMGLASSFVLNQQLRMNHFKIAGAKKEN